jgi:predicted DNA-binding transcriptional regulator AlpA
MNEISEAGFLRIWQIIGDRRRGVPPLIPVSKATWWQWVKDGKAPKPIKLSLGVTVWRAGDIFAMVEAAGGVK